MLGCKAADTPIKANVKVLPDQREISDDPSRYRRLVGKLNYQIVIRPNITLAMSVVSQLLLASSVTVPDFNHLNYHNH